MTPSAQRPAGFTFLEILLVVFIALLGASLAVPAFVHSFRGARLRVSARTVVMAHRYARSIAVLRQQYVAILYDTQKSELQIVAVTPKKGQPALSRPVDIPGVARAQSLDIQDEDVSYTVQTELVRSLEEGVRIDRIELDNDQQEENGIYWINYQPNGMCDAYTITLVDKDGKHSEIRIDPISGAVKVAG